MIANICRRVEGEIRERAGIVQGQEKDDARDQGHMIGDLDHHAVREADHARDTRLDVKEAIDEVEADPDLDPIQEAEATVEKGQRLLETTAVLINQTTKEEVKENLLKSLVILTIFRQIQKKVMQMTPRKAQTMRRPSGRGESV